MLRRILNFFFNFWGELNEVWRKKKGVFIGSTMIVFLVREQRMHGLAAPIFYNLALFLKKVHNWTPGKLKCRNGPKGSAPCVMAPRFHVSAPWITAPRSWTAFSRGSDVAWQGARRHRSRRRAPCYKSADALRYPWTQFIFSSPLSALSLQKPSTNLDSIFGPSKV